VVEFSPPNTQCLSAGECPQRNKETPHIVHTLLALPPGKALWPWVTAPCRMPCIPRGGRGCRQGLDTPNCCSSPVTGGAPQLAEGEGMTLAADGQGHSSWASFTSKEPWCSLWEGGPASLGLFSPSLKADRATWLAQALCLEYQGHGQPHHGFAGHPGGTWVLGELTH